MKMEVRIKSIKGGDNKKGNGRDDMITLKKEVKNGRIIRKTEKGEEMD